MCRLHQDLHPACQLLASSCETSSRQADNEATCSKSKIYKQKKDNQKSQEQAFHEDLPLQFQKKKRLTSTAMKKLKNYDCSSQIQATGQHHLVCSSSLPDGFYLFHCSKPFPSAEKAILIQSDNPFACQPVCDKMRQLAYCGSSSSAIDCALISLHTYLTNYHRIALLDPLFAKSSVDTTCL